MNATTTQAGFDGRTMPGVVVWWALIVAVGGASVLAATVSAASGEQIAAGWYAEFLGMAGALLLPMPFFVLDRLYAERRVLVGRVSPLSSWLAALHHHRRTLVVSWALAAAPLGVLRALSHSPSEPWTTTVTMALLPAGLLAALLGLGLLAAAAWQGLVAWPVGLAAGVTAFALLACGASGDAHEALRGWAGQASGSIGAAMASTLASLLAAGLAWRAALWVHGKVARASELPNRQPSPRQRLQAQRLRWSERWRRVDPTVGIGVFSVCLAQLPGNMSRRDVESHFFQAWGTSVTPADGLRLAMLTLVASLLLRGAAPHWRLLLAPGSGFRRSIGLNVVGSTMMIAALQVSSVIAFSVAVIALLPFLSWPGGVSWSRLPVILVSYGLPLLADLALAVSLAAWLRGWLGSLVRVVAVIAGTVLALVAVSFLADPLPDTTAFVFHPMWNRGFAHLAGELALAACFTLLAQRAWARADLGALVRQPRSPLEDER